jgi:RimJ/RimL family protein N-acetyltransferase
MGILEGKRRDGRPGSRQDRHMTTTRHVLPPVEIAAGRLQLRPYAEGDVDAVFAACQDPDIQRFTTVAVPYLREHAAAYVRANSDAGWAAGTGRAFAITDATLGIVLGSVGLVAYDPDRRTGEVGFWTVPSARGQGVMTAAVLAVARWAFGAVGLARFEWRAETDNAASRRVAEKAGFTIEGVLRAEGARRDGTRADLWIGSLLPADLA